MIELRLGEVLRTSVTGKVYEIKWIKDQMVILKSMEGVNQVLTWKNNLDLFYEELPKGKGLSESLMLRYRERSIF